MPSDPARRSPARPPRSRSSPPEPWSESLPSPPSSSSSPPWPASSSSPSPPTSLSRPPSPRASSLPPPASTLSAPSPAQTRSLPPRASIWSSPLLGDDHVAVLGPLDRVVARRADDRRLRAVADVVRRRQRVVDQQLDVFVLRVALARSGCPSGSRCRRRCGRSRRARRRSKPAAGPGAGAVAGAAWSSTRLKIEIVPSWLSMMSISRDCCGLSATAEVLMLPPHGAVGALERRDLVLVRVPGDVGEHVVVPVDQRDEALAPAVAEVHGPGVARVEVAARIDVMAVRVRCPCTARRPRRGSGRQAAHRVVGEDHDVLAVRGGGVELALQPLVLGIVDVAVGGRTGRRRPRSWCPPR